MSRPIFRRSFPLADVEVAGGEGRTVTAYATLFDHEVEVTDDLGHYMETINRASFNRTLSHGIERIGVFYNHGLTLYHTPAPEFSLPLGTPVEIRADGHGLLTVTRYAKTELADTVLELIRDGAIREMSFQGPIYQRTPRGRHPGTSLQRFEMMELGLREYGPCQRGVQPAAILSVRSAGDLAAAIHQLPPDERTELDRLVAAPPAPGPDGDEDTRLTAPAADPGSSLSVLALTQEHRRRRLLG